MSLLLTRDVKKPSVTAVAGVVTALAISDDFTPTSMGLTNMRVEVEVNTITQVGTLTATLQGKSPNGTYANLAGANATATFTAAGTITLLQNVEVAADQPNMPLPSQMRVVLTTTNAGDRVTVAHVYVTMGNN